MARRLSKNDFSRYVERESERKINKIVAGSHPVGVYRGPSPEDAATFGTVRQRDVDDALDTFGGRGSKGAQKVIDAAKKPGKGMTSEMSAMMSEPARDMIFPSRTKGVTSAGFKFARGAKTIAKAVSRGMLSAPAAAESFAMDAAEDVLESYGDYPGATLRGKKPVRRMRT